MEFPIFVRKHVTFSVLAILGTLAIAQGGPIDGNPAEKDALFGLKATFNDPFLNGNWTGLHCNVNGPSRWFGILCAYGRVKGIVLEGMGLPGDVNVNAFSELEELSILSFKNNSLRGKMMNFSNNHQMKYIDLSGNVLVGSISKSLVSLILLEKLFLHDNRLTGSIPEFSQSSLEIFNVSNNNLEGPIPTTQTLQSFDSASFSGNPRLCGSPSLNSCKTSSNSPSVLPLNSTLDNNEGQNKPSEKNNNSNILIIFNVVFLLAIILLLMLYFNKARKLSKIEKGQIPTVEEEEKDVENSVSKKIEIGEGTMMRVEERRQLIFFSNKPKFQMGELLRASAEALGQGIMGNSYKAMLNDGTPIVVKRLRDLKPLTKEEFSKILHMIADLKHPNLLPLLAYYHSKDEKLMLYRYAQNGNLFSRLHDGRDGNRVPFSWNSRLSVARGVARALEYLHLNNRFYNIIPHGNLRPSNVLFDENDAVLVSDFGLAFLVAQPVAAQHMVVYKSPEYVFAKKVTMQSDVWSYGSLLIELLTGKVSSCSAPPGINGVDICSWVHRAVREEWTAEIFDKEISGQKSALPGMLRLLQIAMRCIERFPEKRPEMRDVVREVEKIHAPLTNEDEDDVSADRSLTDDSFSTSTSGIIGDER
ncbi:pollen receptor-like kinase 4 [Gastrolobium bilobum]|uniref:pollen receptor-like kinase 4 n=1 Tax=Gastrolobium bilobum TaxID=150636 RepID=UPI002AAFD6D2|nr:pollen receptor-like kinase 4 [Gastrolobium bilobum]